MSSFTLQFNQALKRRESLIEKLHTEGTNSYRLFHGITEGTPGLTIDKYGDLIIMQTFREPLLPEIVQETELLLRNILNFDHYFAYNHRGDKSNNNFDLWHTPTEGTTGKKQCTEFGVKYIISARHKGIDPWMFLDLRVGRRLLKDITKNASMLNLFSYTGSAGVCACIHGAKEVWNVDFSSSSLKVARENAKLNQIEENNFITIEEDCLPVMRQLAGMPVGRRKRTSTLVKKLEPRQFDIVFLDPPAWSKGAYGAVDVLRDYQSLFKPAILATKDSGGIVIATNHIASVAYDSWSSLLKKCALKANKPLRSIMRLMPEEDFPSFDGNPPLKIAVCEL